MRYRALDANGDYQFMGTSPFLINTPEAVAQAVLTRLRLMTNEWFLNSKEGLAKERILGYGTAMTRDLAIKRRILDTAAPDGTALVTRLRKYYSTVENRNFKVVASIDTIYGPANINLNEIL